MKVRDCHTIWFDDPETGTRTCRVEERWIETQDIELHEAREQERKEREIQQELHAHAIASFDDLISGDPQKLKTLRDQRAAIRSKPR